MMDDVNCEGTKTSLLKCKYSKTDDCGATEGLACADPGVRTPIGVSGIVSSGSR